MPLQSELQRITLSPAPTAGTFTLTFSGHTTGLISYQGSSADITDACENGSLWGSGDVTVTGGADSGQIDFDFSPGALANTNVPQIACDASALTVTHGDTGGPADPTVTNTRTGVVPVVRIQTGESRVETFTVGGLDGTFKITGSTGTSSDVVAILGSINPTALQGAYDQAHGGSNTSVADNGGGTSFTVTFVNGLACVAGLSTTVGSVVGVGTPTISASVAGKYEIQEFRGPSGWSSGAIQLLGGNSGGVALVSFGDSAATVLAAVQLGGFWTSSGRAGVLSVQLMSPNVWQLTAAGSGPQSSFDLGNCGISTANSDYTAKQTVTLPAGVNGGTVQLTDGDSVSDVLRPTSDSGDVQDVMNTPASGDFSPTWGTVIAIGDTGSPWTATASIAGPIALLTITNNTLTKPVTATPSTIRQGGLSAQGASRPSVSLSLSL